jgi:dihydrofolate reductase
MKISIIVAHSLQGIIGINGKIPWDIPEDLKRFKQLTMGKPIIMGRKTFESFGSKPLPGRLNVVISPSRVENYAYELELGVLWTDSLPTALRWLQLVGRYEEVFVIGGERLYREAIPLADTIYRTVVLQDPPLSISDSDEVAYFPRDAMRLNQWDLERIDYLAGGHRAEIWSRVCNDL